MARQPGVTPPSRITFDPWQQAIQRNARRSADLWAHFSMWKTVELEYGCHERIATLAPSSIVTNWMLSFRRARRITIPRGTVLGSMTMNRRCHVTFAPGVTVTHHAMLYAGNVDPLPSTVRIGMLHLGGPAPIDICDTVVRIPGLPAVVVQCLAGMKLGDLVRCGPLQHLHPFSQAVIVEAYLEELEFGSWTFLILDRAPLWNEMLQD